MGIYRCNACGRINRVATDRGKHPHCGQCKADLDVSGKPQEVDSAALKRAIKASPVPVLLDVWAPWCGPCRMVAPVLEEVGRQRKGELMILKLNSDENPQMSSSLGIRGIPTMVLYQKGSEAARQSGAMPKPTLEAWLDART